MKDRPNKVTTVLKVVVTGEFYDDDATEETLRYAVEQDLEDAGFDVDVALLKEQDNCENCAIAIEDRQPVVRCKYCNHSTEWYGDKRRCFLWNENGIDVFEDGYCSYGKPKQKGQ